ncbi:MAG TPA: chromosome segregation protein SMC [Ilumatobacteraceae bacterium]|nr:chromosome segregation protein SMC [Ilumatobacteraceae bacterium]
MAAVFLKSLTLKGFKSFADPTTLQLEPGVTVVVGPNGSGKSNVVDAIAWVLGAQAPSAVRSQKMDDVIFAGTAKRPALGRAEVSLTIDNSAGLLPIEFTEVTVARILFRTGESEYSINGVTCRLLDVQELLSDAGVGRQQHVIVSQGQIDAVLNARPEERRSIIEEAAGVLKFRRRKERAERRLDATEASLLRVQDLLREVRRQLRPLERQAEAARRHGDLITELSALQIFLRGREIASLRTRLAALAGEKLSLHSAEQELRTELAGLDTGVMAAEGELTARGDLDLSDEMVRVEQLRERARGIAAVLVERRRSMERDRGQLMDSGVVANLEADADNLRGEMQQLAHDLGQLGPEAEQLAIDEAEFVVERESQLSTVEVVATTSAASAAAEVRGELRSLRGGADRAAAELERFRTRYEMLRDRIGRLDADAESRRVDCEQAQVVEAGLVTDLEAAEARRRAAEVAHEAAAAARQASADDVSRWGARAEALNLALEGARARAGSAHLAGVEEVLGTLLDLIEIDSGWEAAVEAALGDALEAVVVASPKAGRRALESLHAANVHGAVLALGAVYRSPVLPSTQGAPVRTHVRSNHDGVPQLLDAIIGSAVCVPTWTEAIDAALRNPQSVVVTDDGDRFGPSGWRVGAVGGGATASALEEAQERLGIATAELERCANAEQVGLTALHEARRREAVLSAQLDAHDAGFSATSDALARTQGERRDAQAELETLEHTLAEAAERLGRERARIAELEGLVPELEAGEAAEAEATKSRGETRARLDARAAQLAHRRQDLEVRNAGLHERQQFLERRLHETERRLEADVEARAQAGQRRREVEQALGAVEALATLVDRHRHVIEARHNELMEIRRRQSDEVRGIAQRLDDLRRRRSAAEKALDEVRERSRRVEIDEAEVRMRLEGVVEAVRRDHDLEPEAAEIAGAPQLPEGISAAARVRDLERELRLMGPINPLALEEFNELQARHTFLEEQLEDVRTTRRDLMRVIKAVDLEIQSVFSAAFDDVSRHFTELFAMLFPGGLGALVLTDPDDLLNTGIEVEAKPSGKNVKKLSLLSGGERSLTALAYLFAVFRSRPSPFYVMDEVEAALDDVNLHRFLGLIHEFRQEAQLLVVSHQKRTMEAGDSLLGVTMQPGGSSKVVTERVSAVT